MKARLVIFVCAVITATALQAQNPRNVVLYDMTSTLCGPCTCMDSIIRVAILPAYPRTIPICVHSPLPFGSFFNNYRGKEIYVTFKSYFDPAGFIDGSGIAYEWTKAEQAIDERYTNSNETPVGIAITAKTWEPATREVQMSVDITNAGELLSGDFRCQIFITENNLMQTHRTATGCSTPNDSSGLPFKTDYINEHVIRAVEFIPDSTTVDPHWGEELIASSWPSGETISRSWTIDIDTGWIESNCFINLVVYQDNEDSLYKSAHLQGISQSVTGGVGIGQPPSDNPEAGIRLIYPNPATGWVRVHVAVKEPGWCSLQLLDLKGRTVREFGQRYLDQGMYNVELTLAELMPGNYLFRFHSPAGESVGKLVVN